MDFWSLISLALLLLLAAAAMMVSHVRAWRRVQAQDAGLDAKEIKFRWRQFRRRMQSTTMIALVGVAMAVGYWITPERVSPLVFSAYWGCVVLVVLWFALLAVADMIATKHHFGRVEQTHQVEKAKLDAQLRKLKAEQGNGQSSDDPDGKPA